MLRLLCTSVLVNALCVQVWVWLWPCAFLSHEYWAQLHNWLTSIQLHQVSSEHGGQDQDSLASVCWAQVRFVSNSLPPSHANIRKYNWYCTYVRKCNWYCRLKIVPIALLYLLTDQCMWTVLTAAARLAILQSPSYSEKQWSHCWRWNQLILFTVFTLPYWQNGKVDLALWGHHHSYQRTCPVFNSECVEGGTTHVVIGMGGQSLSKNLK